MGRPPSEPPPGWQLATWQGKPSLNPDGTQRVRLSGTMNTRTLEEAWEDYWADPCPYEHIVARVPVPAESSAPGPATEGGLEDDVRAATELLLSCVDDRRADYEWDERVRHHIVRRAISILEAIRARLGAGGGT